jgi:hypothetical protein
MMKRLLVAALAISLVASTGEAQRRYGGGYGYIPGNENNVKYDGRFTFARIRYAGTYKLGPEGPGWSHDYPIAENNFLQILKEITIMKPFMEGSVILDLNDPELFKFPVAYLSEPGGWYPSESEVEGLRAYLQKGGFLIFDDWNGNEYYNGIEQLKRVLPKAAIVELDLTHPIFDSFFKIEDKHITGQDAMFLGIYEDNDPKKRLIALLNYNNDLGERWQYSSQGFNPLQENEAYKLGVNYIIYAMTR